MTFGRPKRGEEHPLASMSNARAERLRRRYQRGEASIRDLQKETGRAYETMRKIVNGTSYRDR